MMRKIGFLFLTVVLLQSCNIVFKAPPFTDVEKLLMLKNGMSLEKVKNVLGIDPYDVYHLNEENSLLVTFSYRLKERRYKVRTFNQDEILRKTTDEESQTKGSVAYNKSDPRTAFVLFKNNEMVSLITTDGKRSSEHLMILSNNLVKIDKEDITDYDLIEVDITVDEEVGSSNERKKFKLFRKRN